MNELNDYNVWDLPFVRSFLTTDIVSVGREDEEEEEKRGSKRGKRGEVVILEAVGRFGGGEGGKGNSESLAFEKGDVFECSKNEMLHDWRFVTRRTDGATGFVPSNLMKETG
uniref:SH3 domain-containing protein n=1 Tax=Paramoeba aestuarina TaxID=180227 RepID=A0A7S4JMW2_9EUKA